MELVMERWIIPLNVKKLLLFLGFAIVGCTLISDTQPVSTTFRMVTPIEEELPIGIDSTMLLGIFSTLSEEELKRRQLIRETYLSLSKVDDRVCDMQRYRKNRFGCRLVYAFVVGSLEEGPTLHHNDAEPLVVEPADLKLYGDIFLEEDVVYLNIKENMEYGKSLTWFKYGASIAKELRIDYIGKIDSDAYLKTGELLALIKNELPPVPYNRCIYGGRPLPDFQGSSVYMAGQFYFVSSDLAWYVSYEMNPKERDELTLNIEDLDFGRYVSSHTMPIKFFALHNRIFWMHPIKKEDQWREYHEDHRGGDVLQKRFIPYADLCEIWKEHPEAVGQKK